MITLKDNEAKSENEIDADGDQATELNSAETPSKLFSKKKLIIISLLLIIFIAAGVAAFIFVKKHKEDVEVTQNDQKMKDEKQEVFHDMDELIVNLNTENKNVSFMKLTITLDIEGKENLDVAIKLMPRIRDVFQIYLRELRPADMQGSIGLYRLREELLLRVNKLVYPAQVKDILFKEVLVQ